MTLKDLSEATGLSQAFLSEVENGKANPTIDTLRRLAKGLSVSLFDILSEEESFVDIVRARERRVVNSSEYNVDYELVSTLLPSAKSQVVMAWLYPIGLGLYISRATARAHGGDLWAENRPGGGTVMCLRLPLAEPWSQTHRI